MLIRISCGIRYHSVLLIPESVELLRQLKGRNSVSSQLAAPLERNSDVVDFAILFPLALECTIFSVD